MEPARDAAGCHRGVADDQPGALALRHGRFPHAPAADNQLRERIPAGAQPENDGSDRMLHHVGPCQHSDQQHALTEAPWNRAKGPAGTTGHQQLQAVGQPPPPLTRLQARSAQTAISSIRQAACQIQEIGAHVP